MPSLPETAHLDAHVNGHNGSSLDRLHRGVRKQRVTITLSLDLLERLRNAVYWTGHGTLACLIAEALDNAVSQMEDVNGGPFAKRLAPLKRGRPKLRPRCLTENGS
ncbi:MAG TPA: hypothetical protein VJ746_05970 [Nitrospira sp.]|nr:hypothetical protein [Nitrospira sp.]